MYNELNILHRFKEFDPSIQVCTIITLLEIAKAVKEDREISTRDIQELLGLSSGATSRNVSYWAAGNGYMKGAYGFVDIGFHSEDRRLRSLTLTPKGKAFTDRLGDA